MRRLPSGFSHAAMLRWVCFRCFIVVIYTTAAKKPTRYLVLSSLRLMGLLEVTQVSNLVAVSLFRDITCVGELADDHMLSSIPWEIGVLGMEEIWFV